MVCLAADTFPPSFSAFSARLFVWKRVEGKRQFNSERLDAAAMAPKRLRGRKESARVFSERGREQESDIGGGGGRRRRREEAM